MEIYCISDIHINSYIPSSEGWGTTAKYEKFLADNTLPADALVIGGDIAHDVVGAVNLLSAAAKMFDKVIWIPGNSEYRCWNKEQGLLTAEKLSKIDKFARTKSKANQIIRLDGNSTIIQDGVKVAGGLGMADAKWFMKNNTNQEENDVQVAWESSPYRFWQLGTNDFSKISKDEIDRILRLSSTDADYVVTHFAPSNLLKLDKYPNIQQKANKQFLAFNAKKLTDELKDGSIYQYGHVHIKDKRTVKNKNGEFLLINNSIGRKTDLVDNPKHLTKKDFLLTL